MALDALYIVVVNGNEPLDRCWECARERWMSDRGVSKGVEAVQVLVKNESVDVKVGEDAHKGVGWLEGVYFGPKRLVCRDVCGVCWCGLCGWGKWVGWRLLRGCRILRLWRCFLQVFIEDE